ncbi:methyl-accepting chemotaxis protein [Paenibacillus endoradicis]|uniref:methyl-accepting chemotaxis protein n=1 Tax=Paenibacillus endoradicis TaxID=2972487 RepID=UPI00215914E7|nr:methyl-accepting chemotaxis protein [Paenibacillus endoradicis]MCR8657628.1 methyl-accepting chemotaxis protein [Paenibacillus endoradicis]
MNHRLSELDKRNRLLVSIMWAVLALGVVTDISIGLGWEMILLLIVIGSIMNTIATVMTFIKSISAYVKYVLPFGLSSIVTVLIVSDPEPVISTYFLIYVNLGIMTLYSDFRPLILTGILGGVVTTYIYLDPMLQQRLFPNESLLFLFLYLFFATLTLCASAQFTQRLQREVFKNEAEAVHARKLAEQLIEKLKTSILMLNVFSSSQKEQVQKASTISKEVTTTFGEMTVSVEQQTNHIISINDSTQQIDLDIKEMTESSALMKEYSQTNANLNDSNTIKMQQVSDEMMQLRQSTERTLQEMKELRAKNEHVSEIVDTINDIAKQIHLLALNAAIEAARAGEHGKGFAVVSGEVGKLADHTRQSVDEISELLSNIHHSIDAVYQSVEQGNDSVVRSDQSLQSANKVLELVQTNTKLATEQTNKVTESTKRLGDQSSLLAHSMNSISAMTQQNMAAVEEVNENMELQYDNMENMVEQYEQLDQLLHELKELVEHK